MHTGSGRSVSPWMGEALSRGPLREDEHADVCIVGAGIAGLTTAYLLGRQGRRVVVVDDGPLVGGETLRTTAHLSNAIDDRYVELERVHGEEGARLAAESHSAAIERIEAIVREEGIDCDFERLDGYLVVGPGRSAGALDEELASARRAGLAGVELLDRAPFAPETFAAGPCLRFPRQGQFHPRRYLAHLAKAIERDGGRLFTGTHIQGIHGGHPARAAASTGPTVWAEAIVVATNTPVNDMLSIHTKQAPYRTYVIAARLPRGSVPHALYWDTLNPYHYVRFSSAAASPDEPDAQHELLIVGGEDHKTGQDGDPVQRWVRLEEWARERFPMIERVEFRWSGQVMETLDGLGYIGHNPGDEENVFIATGDSGMGMTHGTIAGMLLSDLILGRANPWQRLYDPQRRPLAAGGTWLRENLNVAEQLAAYLTGGEVRDEQAIPRDTGAIIRHGLHKLAVYRDERGELHRLSAVCPHARCIVAWNPVEKTWDCPCHGSRFNAYGQVVNGPSNVNLHRREQ